MTGVRPYMSRLRRRRRGYERPGGIDARGRYGYTARHVFCDRCHVPYLPQHVSRSRWLWECSNCLHQQGRGYPVRTLPERFQNALHRHRYRDEPDMLRALGLDPAPAEDGGSHRKERTPSAPSP